jgi:hypothetical protein
VAPREWDGVLRGNHVLVMTPQLLLNLLDGGHAHFDRIDLLVRTPGHKYLPLWSVILYNKMFLDAGGS